MKSVLLSMNSYSEENDSVISPGLRNSLWNYTTLDYKHFHYVLCRIRIKNILSRNTEKRSFFLKLIKSYILININPPLFYVFHWCRSTVSIIMFVSCCSDTLQTIDGGAGEGKAVPINVMQAHRKNWGVAPDILILGPSRMWMSGRPHTQPIYLPGSHFTGVCLSPRALDKSKVSCPWRNLNLGYKFAGSC